MLRSRCNWLGRNGIFTSFLFACFFSLKEMFYICDIIQGYPPLSPPIEFAPSSSPLPYTVCMSGVILMGEFKI